MEDLHNIFSHFKIIIKQIRHGSMNNMGRFYDSKEDFQNTCDFIREESLHFNSVDVIAIAEPLLSEFHKLNSEIGSIIFSKPSNDLFEKTPYPRRYTKQQAKDIIKVSISTLESILEDSGPIVNPKIVTFKIGINTKLFTYIIGLLVKVGVIQVPVKEEMYLFIANHFLTKDGKPIGKKSVANNFMNLDESARMSPEKPIDIVDKLSHQISKEKL